MRFIFSGETPAPASFALKTKSALWALFEDRGLLILDL
jgi:hypothetical protein